jgi:exopolyphosphatase / guanosine-5'-triphosphate,3'-diphosphate pyrophosphatase
MRAGVIDIGTLKVKFQIVEKTAAGKVKTIEQSNVLTCLGCNMGENNNKPKSENLKKVYRELLRCKRLLKKYKVSRVRVVSTHALREMGKVGREIAELIKKKTGFKVEIISQQEEAELFYKAVLTDFKTDQDYTILDMGGGSAQILIGNRKELKKSFLLKTGTSTMWDKFTRGNTGKDHPTRDQLKKMKDYILKELQLIPENLQTPVIWGSSCVIDLFKGIRVPVQKFNASTTHPHKTKLSHLEKFLEKIWKIPLDTREEMYKSPTPKYMWGMDTALMNVIELGKKVGAEYVIPSNANINQGLIDSLIN